MSVYEGSRYLQATIFNYVSGVPQLRPRKPVRFNLDGGEVYRFQLGDRVDSIAHKFYNNAQLYWAIMDANPQYFSELEIKVGDVLNIPSYEEVKKYAL